MFLFTLQEWGEQEHWLNFSIFLIQTFVGWVEMDKVHSKVLSSDIIQFLSVQPHSEALDKLIDIRYILFARNHIPLQF